MKKKTILYKTLQLLILLLFLTGIAGAPVQAKNIIKPVEEVGMCPSDLRYVWHGTLYTDTGTYTYTKTLPNGDKEIYTLKLHDMQLRTITAKIMEGTRVNILGKNYTTPGTYYDTIFSIQQDGCDTLVRLNIQYGEYFHAYDTIHLCEGDAWPVWHGKQTNKPGTYFDRHKGRNGRDSVYQLTLYKHYNVEYWDTIYVCSPQKVYYLNGQRIVRDGDYDSDVKSPYGCDSLLHAHILFVQSPEPVVNEIYFCGNMSIIRRDTGLVISKETSLFDTIPTACGCDSIIETRYIPYPTHLTEQVSPIYVGKDTVPWRGNNYTEVGVYYDTLTNQYGCDSVFQLRVIPKTDTYLVINTCIGESTLHGNAILKDTITITKDTLIVDTLKNGYGGDSLIHTTYNFVQPFHLSQSITICSNQYVKWAGHIREGETEEIVFHEAGIYRDEHRTLDGCDSSYTMNVKVLPAYNDTVLFVRCNDSLYNNPIVFTDSKGKVWRWSDHNTDTVISDTMAHTMPQYLDFADGSSSLAFFTGGCDSIINYRIITGDFCSPLDRYPLCQGSSITVDEKTYTQPGIYHNWLYTERNYGVADSVHNFEIFLVVPKVVTLDTTLHELVLPYMYHGTRITQGGSYTVVVPDQYGCDSTIHLNVTVLPTIIKPAVTYLICPDPGSYYQFPDGRRYSQPGTYLDTIFSHSNQVNDTIVQVTLQWADKQFYDKTDYFLHGETYTWTGHQENGVDRQFTEAGVYWDIQKNMSGCDSIYRLELKEAQPFFGDEGTITLCSSELPYMWHNKSVTKADIYYDSLMTVYGLDSVWQVEILVNPSYKETQQITLCPGESYILSDGSVISGTATTYQAEFQTKDGCDSVIIYYINRPEAAIQTTSKWFRDGDVYTWTTPLNNVFTCDHSGEYYDTLRSRTGCDSIIYHLHLTKEYSYFVPKDSSVCLSEGEYFVNWHGQQCFTSGTYYDSLTTRVGLDSVIAINLTIGRDTVVQWHVGLCQDSTYDFFGNRLTTPGVYRSQPFPRFKTGCDSIIELILQPASSMVTEVRYKLCEGDYVAIGNSNVSTAGVYLDTLTSSHGCDSVVRYIISVGKKYFFSTEEMINPGSSFTWTGHHNDIVYSIPGTYWDSCKTAFGCDSIYKLTLKFNEEVFIFPTETINVCSADLPYVWHNKSLTATDLYYDSLKTNKGLDSIYSIYLNVHQTEYKREILHFCEGDRHEIKGIPYERDTAFTDTLVSHWGCDSIVDYVLHFHPTYSISLIVNLKEGESYILGDTILKTAGVYFKRFKTQYNCDSTVTVRVKTCPATQEVVKYYDLCEGEQLRIGGKTITTSGTYYEHRTAVDGCDSLITHIVNVHTAYLYTITESICRGAAYTWQGHFNDTVLDKPGVYNDYHTTIHGCDSIYRLVLNYKRTDVRDTVISVCQSDLPYTYKGERYFNDSVFADTLGLNMEGCDSIIHWNYRVNYHCSEYAQYSRCPDQTTSIDGILVSAAGTYEQYHLTETGEDSVYRFIVHDVKKYEFTTKKRGCDSIVYDGRTYFARGKGQETFTVDIYHRTIEGCDSLEHLEMTIYQSSTPHVFSKTIADYDSIRFGPYWYNTSGSYSLKHTNIFGCDSIEILQLNVLKTDYPETEHYFMCEGDPKGVEIFGRLHHPTQEYTFISDTAWIGGQPVIRTADITVQHPFTVTQFRPNIDQIVCSDHEVLFYVNYATIDASILPDYYEVDFQVGDLEAHPLHQDGVVEGKTTLPILMSGQGKFVSPGYYRYRLKLRSESCLVSDTILEGSILVRYPSEVMESAWNDVVMLVNEKYNGGSWVFKAPYQWQVFSEQGLDKTALVVGDVTQPYLYSSALEEGDRIIATLIREGYGQPVPSCEFIFKPTLAALPNAILVYPTATEANTPVTVSSKKAGSFRLSNYTGHTCTTGRFGEGETQIRMPGVEGCYILMMEDEQGNKLSQKLIVY